MKIIYFLDWQGKPVKSLRAGNFTIDLLWIIPIHILPSPQVSSSKSIIKRLSSRMPAIKVSLQLKSIQVPPHLGHVIASRPLGSPHASPKLSGPWGGRAEWLTSLRCVSCHSCNLLHDFIFFSLGLCDLKETTGIVSVVRSIVLSKGCKPFMWDLTRAATSHAWLVMSKSCSCPEQKPINCLLVRKASRKHITRSRLFRSSFVNLIFRGVTAEYPATSSALGKMAGYAVRRENKFKMAVYLKLVATRYAVRGENKFSIAQHLMIEVKEDTERIKRCFPLFIICWIVHSLQRISNWNYNYGKWYQTKTVPILHVWKINCF